MKRLLTRSVAPSSVLCLSLLLGSLAHANFMETPHEFQFTADLDGDGRLDLVIIDRASGGFRAAYQKVPGSWEWSAARSTGMNQISGAAVGRWFVTGHDGFAVVSPGANRAHIVHAKPTNGLPTVNPVFAQGLGPAQVAAPDIGGPGNTVHSDLWISSVENGAPTPGRMTTLRHNGSTFLTLTHGPVVQVPSQVRMIRLKEGGLQYIGMIAVSGGNNDPFYVLSYASGAAATVVSTSFPEGSAWTSGLLGAGPLHHVLTWQPGDMNFFVRAVVENLPDVFSLSAAVSHDVGVAIGQLSIVASDEGPRLVAIDETGESVEIYEFDGLAAPALLQEIQAGPGDVITGLLPIASGGFHLLSGRSGKGMTETMTSYAPSGGTFVAGAPNDLPALRPAALRANAFAFDTEPFVDPAAALLAQFNAPEWTSDPILAGGELTVAAEIFGTSASGLGAKAPVSLGTVPMGTAFSLTNQYNGAISLHSLSSDTGVVGASAEIFPIPGIKTKGFYLQFSSVPQPAPVFYRIDDGAWTPWTGGPHFIYTNTTVTFFARHPVTQEPSPLRTAKYEFQQAPHEIDSNGDGIPDFVRLAFGLDPLGGADSDGDGFSDLNEMLVGTDPEDSESRPNASQRLEENLAFRMRVAPHPIDGSTGTRTSAADEARLELFALNGSSLGGGAATELGTPGVTGPGLRLDAVVADHNQGFVVVMTEPVFKISTADADKDRGREIAALYAMPQATLPEVDYTPGGGPQLDEAFAWLAAAQIAWDSAERPVVSGMWNEIDTLAALLLERKLEAIFLDRAVPGLAPGKLTLFGGRRGDAGRFAPSAANFRDLRDRISGSLPGYLIENLFAGISAAAVNNPVYEDLRSAASAIYEVSSAFGNDADPGHYLPPFDVLRAFVRGAPLPEPYLSEVGIAPATLAAAQASIDTLLNGLPSRPVETFTLLVEEDSFSGGCHRLIEEGTNLGVNLFASPGLPYASTDGFALLPGTKLSVTGYSDLDEGGCPGIDVEVLYVTVISFPIPSLVDANQNLLPDNWEWVFLLGGGNPFDDDDGDGFSNLQEYFDQTDPLDPNSNGTEPVDLSPPAVAILMNEFEDVGLWWTYSPYYGQFIDWIAESSDNLVHWTPMPDAVLELEPGFFALLVPVPEDNFFRIRMLLK